MQKLNCDEETYLRELCEHEESGGDVADFIQHRLYEDLSQTEIDVEGSMHLTARPNYQRAKDIFDALVQKGALKEERTQRGSRISGLTSDGRSYFRNKEIAEKKRREELLSDRKFQIGLSVITLVLSTALGTVGGCVSSKIANQGGGSGTQAV